MRNTIILLVFWGFQILAHLFFKYGSLHPERWWFGFALGNFFGATSIWFIMMLYKSMNANVALGLGAGGGFLCCQAALMVVYGSRLSMVQTLGILGITVGMALLAAGGGEVNP